MGTFYGTFSFTSLSFNAAADAIAPLPMLEDGELFQEGEEDKANGDWIARPPIFST